MAVGTPDELRRSAFGGDVIVVRLTERADDRVTAEIESLDGVNEVRWLDQYRLRVIVEGAGRALPAIQQHLDGLGIGVEESAEVPVDWDATFIALVQEQQEQHEPVQDEQPEQVDS